MGVLREFNHGGFFSIKWAAVDIIVIASCILKLAS